MSAIPRPIFASENQVPGVSGETVVMPTTAKALALVAIAEREYRARRKRAALFRTPHLFGEPAFDILLDLFVAYARDQQVSITSACLAADVPMTTALRYVTTLEAAGLVLRQEDPIDRRRSYVKLSSRAVAAMEKYLRCGQPS